MQQFLILAIYVAVVIQILIPFYAKKRLNAATKYSQLKALAKRSCK